MNKKQKNPHAIEGKFYKKFLKYFASIFNSSKTFRRCERRKDILLTMSQADNLKYLKKQGVYYSKTCRTRIVRFIIADSKQFLLSNNPLSASILKTKEPLSKMRVSVTLDPNDMKVLDAIVKKYKVSYSDVIRFALGKPLQAPLDNSWKNPLLKKGA